MSLPPLILASASPRRSDVLRRMGVPFQVFVGGASEAMHEHLTPRELSQLNAYRKARVVAKRFPDSLVLGADTVVCLGDRLFGKPATLAEAEAMLDALQGRKHEVITGVCLIHLRQHKQRLFAESSSVTFRSLDRAVIRRYLRRIDPLDKAGAYGIQEGGDLIIESYEGSYTNVVGLPAERLTEALRDWD